jgi:uncharacterized protein
LSDVNVVDADVHAHETSAAPAPYCDMPWRRSLEVLAGTPERYLDIPGFAPAPAGHVAGRRSYGG